MKPLHRSSFKFHSDSVLDLKMAGIETPINKYHGRTARYTHGNNSPLNRVSVRKTLLMWSSFRDPTEKTLMLSKTLKSL